MLTVLGIEAPAQFIFFRNVLEKIMDKKNVDSWICLHINRSKQIYFKLKSEESEKK